MTFPVERYKNLIPYATTDKQREILQQLCSGVSQRQVARERGVNKSTIQTMVHTLEGRKDRHNNSLKGPMKEDIPESYLIDRASLNVNEEGKVTQRWLKVKSDENYRFKMMEKVLTELAEQIEPIEAIPFEGNVSEDSLVVIPLGDPHIGLLAHAAEAGEDFGLKEAERRIIGAIQYMVEERLPSASEALFINLGDALHADDSTNKTRASGNQLDVAARHWKCAEAAVNILNKCVEVLATKFPKVTVWNMKGNHDEDSSDWLNLVMRSHFRHSPRINIDYNPSVFRYRRWGNNLLASHHGHSAKLGELAGIMANDCPKDWGETKFRNWFIGHFHHKQKFEQKEFPGVIVETFNTLAASDAWHFREGYRSRAMIQAIMFDKEVGETGRVTVSLSAIEQYLNNEKREENIEV